MTPAIMFLTGFVACALVVALTTIALRPRCTCGKQIILRKINRIWPTDTFKSNEQDRLINFVSKINSDRCSVCGPRLSSDWFYKFKPAGFDEQMDKIRQDLYDKINRIPRGDTKAMTSEVS